MRPKVSVIMPSLNVVAYIRECIESVTNQTLREIEIICVDAGSTDGTLEILQKYALWDKRIKLIISDKKSYGYQMNLGLDASSGEYVAIVETDDYVPLNMYEELYQAAVENSVDFVKADFYRFKHAENGQLELDYNHLSEEKSYYGRVIDPKEEQEIFNFIMNTWSGIYNTAFLHKNNIRHNESPGASFQDTGFWFQTLCCAERALFVRKPYYMNRRDNPNSSVYNRNKIFCVCDEFDYIYDFLNRNLHLKEIFLPMYQYQRYRGYMASLNRSADELKCAFLAKFKDDYVFSMQNGELDDRFFTSGAKRTLWEIMKDPKAYYTSLHQSAHGSNQLTYIMHRVQRVSESCSQVGFMRTAKRILRKLRRNHE